MKKPKEKSAAKPATKSKALNRASRAGGSKGKKATAAKDKPAKPSAKIKETALIAAEVTDGIPSLPRLRQILGEYYQPVLDYEPIGNRVPFPTLTERINTEWNLTGGNRFQNGEITPATIVIDLSEDIDYRATH
jgi:hypothetical protein